MMRWKKRGDKKPAQSVSYLARGGFMGMNGNYRGGMKMLLRVRQWLDPLPAHCRGVNIDQLRQDVDAVQRLLTQLGPDRIAEFDKTLFRPIDYEEDNKY